MTPIVSDTKARNKTPKHTNTAVRLRRDFDFSTTTSGGGRQDLVEPGATLVNAVDADMLCDSATLLLLLLLLLLLVTSTLLLLVTSLLLLLLMLSSELTSDLEADRRPRTLLLKERSGLGR
jgi:hypothetical protein